MVKEVSVHELHDMQGGGEDFQLIDVREHNERSFCNIGGDHIPLDQFFDDISVIQKDKPVIIYCRSGGRSGQVVAKLQNEFGFSNVFNLTGGILEWSDQIDSSIPKY